jgi:hypothetical protein
MEDKVNILAKSAESENLPELLKDRIGISLGEFPSRERFNLVNIAGSEPSAFSSEKMIDRVCRLDFILLDSECEYLSDLPYVLENLGKRLVNHGLILLFDKSVGDRRHTLWHKILSSGEVEFLSESAFENGTLYLFQWIKPREVHQILPKPLRYRIVDRVSRMLSAVPGVKRFLKNMARAFGEFGAGSSA